VQEAGHENEIWIPPVFPAFSCNYSRVGANTGLASGFDASTEGWTATSGIGGAINLAREAAGGNPGGCIAAADGGTQQWYFISPASRDVDWTSYIGGMLHAFDGLRLAG